MVLFFHHGIQSGGAPTSLSTLLTTCKNNGIEFNLYVTRNQAKKLFNSLDIAVGTYFYPYNIVGRLIIGFSKLYNPKAVILLMLEILYLPKALSSFCEILNRHTNAIVYLNSSTQIVLAIAAKLLGHKVYMHIREENQGSSFLGRRLLFSCLAYLFLDEIICISENERDKLSWFVKDRCLVVYNGIFVENSKFELQENKFAKRVVCVGGLSFRKGSIEFLRLSKYFPELTFELYGHSPLKSFRNKWWIQMALFLEDVLLRLRLKAYYSWFYDYRFAAELRNSSGNFHIKGSVENIFEKIRGSIVFHGATMTHFPRPIFEASLSAYGFIASNVDGVVRHVIVKNRIFDRKDINSIKQSLKYSIDNPLTLEEFSYARDNFNAENNNRVILDLLK